MTKTKQEKSIECDITFDICLITHRKITDVRNTAMGQVRARKVTIIVALDEWLKELKKDPYYLLPGDENDPRHPTKIRPDRERDYA